MRRTPLFVPLVLVVVLAAVPGTTTPSSADPPRRSTEDAVFYPAAYPRVQPSNAGCENEAAAVATATANHAEAFRRVDSPGSVTPFEYHQLKRALFRAAVALTNAKYNQSQCWLFNAPLPRNVVCVALGLELNRLGDLVAIAQERWKLAESDYLTISGLYGRQAATKTELDQAKAEYDAAKQELDTVKGVASLVGGLVAVLQRLGVCSDYPFQRTACSAPAPGADPSTATASTSQGDDGLTSQMCVALDETAVPDAETIDTYDEWLAAVEDTCTADPECGITEVMTTDTA